MLRQISSTIARCETTILQDAAGVAALIALLVAGLHIPALV
jgi:hypothetical protein